MPPAPTKANRAALEAAAAIRAADAPTGETATDGLWTVHDLNARRRDKITGKEIGRVHEDRTGVVHELFASKGKQMTSAQARTFLMPGFKVLNEKGEEVQNIPDEALKKAGEVPKIEVGQSVAWYEELTTQALLARCARRPGGERFNQKTARQVLIDFLHDRATADVAKPSRKAASNEPADVAHKAATAGVTDMTEDELASMHFGD